MAMIESHIVPKIKIKYKRGQWRPVEANGGQWRPLETTGGQERPINEIS